jgi:hypothetical protein
MGCIKQTIIRSEDKKGNKLAFNWKIKEKTILGLSRLTTQRKRKT